MQYLISFIEGFITFISPCMLPMIPIYISYFVGDADASTSNKKNKALKNSLGFVFGFSLVFILLGALAGSLGSFVFHHSKMLNIVGGLLLILFGLNYIGILKINFLNKVVKLQAHSNVTNFLSSVLFGIIFSIGWSPCVGTFLGSALMLAAHQGTVLKGTILLIFYSVGLGIPFVLSAVLIENIKNIFDFIKRNYKIINMVSGLFLIIMGILMMTGFLNLFFGLLRF